MNTEIAIQCIHLSVSPSSSVCPRVQLSILFCHPSIDPDTCLPPSLPPGHSPLVFIQIPATSCASCYFEVHPVVECPLPQASKSGSNSLLHSLACRRACRVWPTDGRAHAEPAQRSACDRHAPRKDYVPVFMLEDRPYCSLPCRRLTRGCPPAARARTRCGVEA